MNRRDFLKTVGATGAATAVGLGGLRFGALQALAAQQPDGQELHARRQQTPEGPPRANTFSICAVNPKTGEAGVAVASKCLSVGALVCYAEPGVGAIATQATVNPHYGREGLKLLRKNLPAAEVVRRLTEQDVIVTPDEEQFIKRYTGEDLTEEGQDFLRDRAGKRILWLANRMRQLGVVDRQGNAATYNGARIVSWSGSVTGPCFSCQGNMLAEEKVIADMAKAFEHQRSGATSLVAPLLAALEAGEAAGGDKRGKQAAAMLVVRDHGHWTGSDRWCDIRVDDHAEPVAELARILKKTGFLK